jgi:integrase
MARKRGQNEGSIYRRKDGRWVAQVTIGGRPICKYFKSQRECRDWLKATNSQIETGLTFKGAQVTLSDYMESWLGITKTAVKPKTYEQYHQIAHQYIIPAMGRMKLKDIRPDQIQTIYTDRLKQGSSARLVVMIHAVLHRSLNQAMKLGLIGRNPASAVTRPKLQHKEMQTLDDTQVRNLLLAAKGSRYEALYQLAVATGMRQGELLGLRWSDLDWDNRRLRVQRQLQRIEHQGLVYSEPKTKAGRRGIVLGKSTIEKLRTHNELQQLERHFAGKRWQENDLIFPTTVGTPNEPSNLIKQFKILLKQAGLPDIRFHDLRHTAATLMLQQGIHPKVVQERLGHSNISMTMDIYSHVLPSMQDEAADKIDELISLIDVSTALSVQP